MKSFISLLWENCYAALFSFIEPFVCKSNNIIPINAAYYSFNGSGISTKYIPSETEVVGFYGGNQIPDEDSGRKEVLNTYWKGKYDEKRFTDVSYKARSVWVWVASTSIILIFAFAIIENNIRNRVIDKTFRTYYSLPDMTVLTSDNSYFKTSPVWDLLVSAYNNRNFDVVRDHFRFVPEGSPVYDYSFFLNGICLIQDHQYQRALESFEALTGNPHLVTAVTWYAGLCYVKLGNLHSATLLFQNIKDKSIYEKKASEIVQKMKTVN